VLGKRDDRLAGDPRLGRGAIDHEDQRFARALAQSTVAPTARKSCGLGRVGITISSASAITDWIAMVIAGGVSITASEACWRST
jgi:hypothetical protein